MLSMIAPVQVSPVEPAEGSMLRRTWVIIPVYNEEQSLPLVLGDLPQVGRVFVVNNGSRDQSAIVARQGGATVVDEPCRGYGAACLAGLAAVERNITESEFPEVVVFLDGDYSDHPDLLPQLIAPIFRGEADFVLGSRTLGVQEPGAMPPVARFGNWLAPWLLWLLWGARFTDLGPFRAIAWPALRELGMRDRNFGWTVEMQIRATVAGLRCREVPVPYRRRLGESKISGTVSGSLRAGYKILYTIARYRWLTWWSL
jgi:glycosyltransferase involved in cell wall biosynthesis